MADDSSTQIMNVFLTPPNDSNIPHKTPIFLYIKVYLYLTYSDDAFALGDRYVECDHKAVPLFM